MNADTTPMPADKGKGGFVTMDAASPSALMTLSAAIGVVSAFIGACIAVATSK